MTGRACLEQGLQALPMDIPASAVDQFLAFSDRLLEKNKVMNLTGIGGQFGRLAHCAVITVKAR